MATDQKSASLASQYRKRRKEGHLWTAPSGASIRVRKLSLSDYAVVGQLPDNLQQIVYKVIDVSTKLRATPTNDDTDIDDVFGDLTGEEKLVAMRDTSIRLAKLGWIEPKVVDTVKDEDTEVGVDEVDADDMLAYMAMIFGAQQQEAQRLTPFPGKPAANMGPRSDEPAILATTERPTGDAAGGVQRPDEI